MFTSAKDLIATASHIVIVQAENPDGDSLGSSLALEELLSNNGKTVTLYCAIDIPKYLQYIRGWDRVVKDWPFNADAIILVDTTSQTLLTKTLDSPSVSQFFHSHPLLVIDHHQEAPGALSLDHTPLINDSAVATGEIIYELAQDAGWVVTSEAAESLFIAIQADSLGLTTQNTTANSYRVAAELVAAGAHPSDIENRRREYMKKPADILEYKGRLISRIQYDLEGKLATVHIPWAEIEEYSDRYNPGALIVDEMRFVDTVEVAVAIKTYPDGKLTGKIRSNTPIAHLIAAFFGGGGHEYSAGFKVYEDYETIIRELVQATDKASTDYAAAIS